METLGIGILDVLDFCLKPWVMFSKEDITVSLTATAGKVATFLVSEKRFGQFESFVSSIPSRVMEAFLRNEQYRRALIVMRRHQGRYKELCELIESGDFSDGSDLVEVWDLAHYSMWERQFRKPLSALIKFRIRKRNPPPPSICQGGRTSRNLSDCAKAVLRSWFNDHSVFPYPMLAERELMAQQTGLTQTQIKTWFSNTRRRTKPVKKKRANNKKAETKLPQGSMKNIVELKQNSEERLLMTSGTLDATSHQNHSSSICNAQYLQSSPHGLHTAEQEGMQGLMSMHNRLTATGSGTATSHMQGFPSCLLHPSSLCEQVPFHATSYCPTSHNAFLSLGPSPVNFPLSQMPTYQSSQPRENLNAVCNVPISVVQPDAAKVFRHTIQEAWPEQNLTRHCAQTKQGNSFPISLETAVQVPVMTPHPPELSQTDTAKSRSAIIVKAKQCSEHVTDVTQMAELPVEMEFLREHDAFFPNQWNIVPWSAAHSPLGSLAPEPDIGVPVTDQLCQVDTLMTHNILYGKFEPPHSMETFLVLQPRASLVTKSSDSQDMATNIPSTMLSSQTSFSTQCIQSWHSQCLEGGTATDVNQAAYILCTMANQKDYPTPKQRSW